MAPLINFSDIEALADEDLEIWCRYYLVRTYMLHTRASRVRALQNAFVKAVV